MKPQRILQTGSFICAALLATLTVSNGSASETIQKIDATFTRTISYEYLVQTPEGYEDSNEHWPLVLFLHGSGERGADIELVKKWGPPRFISAGERTLPAVVVSPQNPIFELDWEPSALVELLDKLIEDYRIDERRIYVTGLSMGGRGTWSLAAIIPDRLAAIAPVCGKGNIPWMERMIDLPCWVFHGTDDRAVDFRRSADLVKALNDLGAPTKFTVYYGGSHQDAWVKAYNESGLWEWMFAQRRDE